MQTPFKNPFRPGAGQLPPYLAGREEEIKYFQEVTLNQEPVLTNLIISGLRGVGKTVLLDTLRPIALNQGWLWAGTDMSEAASLTEVNLSTRLLTDISSAVSPIVISEETVRDIGFKSEERIIQHHLNYELLAFIYKSTPGLESDKLKKVFTTIWQLAQRSAKGIVLAYDEAQNLKDKASDKQYPLSLLLELTQYLQKQNIPIVLILTGLPTLMSNVVEARTYAERMFHQMILKRLSKDQSRQAIVKPIEDDNCPVKLSKHAIDSIIEKSGGYPYFIQYICKQTYDTYIQQLAFGNPKPEVFLNEIIRKLDDDFYQGRWQRATDKQRLLLKVISGMDNAEGEFSLKDIESAMKLSGSAVTTSAISIMLKALMEIGLIYKLRHGSYAFAVPLFSDFVKRELAQND